MLMEAGLRMGYCCEQTITLLRLLQNANEANHCFFIPGRFHR
jgi:hypothetical protein